MTTLILAWIGLNLAVPLIIITTRTLAERRRYRLAVGQRVQRAGREL